ncbi:hypothetical protein [Sutcliffiella halmapala]|uniref:hypothetical protein n=1 Tax=Sutcliffiella halmapala TaxID=79882 RepID=UPI0009958428|nr:hypothetical protein [Sutcliffiella halmapala]
MLQGICVNPVNTEVINKGEKYFLFPNGPDHYYVSKFPNPGAHRGCFLAESFEVIDNEVELHKDKLYRAKLIYRGTGYSQVEFKHYYLKLNVTLCFFYDDVECTSFRGSFPQKWFTDIVEVDSEADNEAVEELTSIDLEEIPIEPESTEFEQLSLF